MSANSTQRMIEYGIILLLVTIVAISSLQFFGESIKLGNEERETGYKNFAELENQNYCRSIHGFWDETEKTCRPSE